MTPLRPSAMITTMSFAEKLLADDERVVIDLRPHPKALAVPVLVFVLSCAIAGVLIGLLEKSLATLIILAVAAGLIAIFSLAPLLRWYCTHFVVSDRRVMMRSGVLARKGRDVPLSRINDIHFEHSLLERVLGCGSLVIESAGERGQVRLREVPGVQQVQRRIYQLVEDTDDRLLGRTARESRDQGAR